MRFTGVSIVRRNIEVNGINRDSRKVFYKKATDILQNISAKYSCFYYVLIIIHSQTDKPGYVVG